MEEEQAGRGGAGRSRGSKREDRRTEGAAAEIPPTRGQPPPR